MDKSKAFISVIQEVDNKRIYSHWSKGLTMIIRKDGQSIKLDSEEIQQLVKSLPRTMGGKY